ncbi:hypothetical protein EON80_29415 [bacterium]|nr:MAG: hypothetical protein EON80_29415 [bacterium]
MPFRFLRDPFFQFSVALFLTNILLLKRYLPPNPITHSYLTDLLCLPVWVPFMLWVIRCLKLRDNAPPRPLEILLPWVFWSVMFEVVLPGSPLLGGFAKGDPLDVAVYGVGGLLGFLIWRAWYRAPGTLKLRA